MNHIILKLFIFINILFVGQVLAVTEERLLNFERECLQSEFEENSEVYNQCLDQHRELEEFLAENQQTQLSESGRQCNVSESVPTPTGLEDLSESVAEASTKLSCTPEDQEEVAKSCGEQLFCNAGRSVSRVLRNIPFTSRLARTAEDYFSSQVSRDQAASCVDQNSSDCLTEVFTAWVSNLIGTVNSLRSVASGIGSTISSIFWRSEQYIEEKGDDLHEFAESKASFISRLYNDFGGTLKESFNSFKSSVDSWIKSEVFCQKWIREPHAIPTDAEREAGLSTTCEQPLESYSCLNCNDGLNAFCAGAGIFLSEGLIAMGTAGGASLISLGARAGAMAIRGAAASRRGAAIISSRVPLIGKMTEEAGTTASRGVASVADETVVRASRLSVALAKVGDVTSAVSSFSEKIANLRIVRIATYPVRVIDGMAARRVEEATRGMTLLRGNGVITRSLRRVAKEDYRAARIGRKRIRANNASVPRRIITGTRVARRTSSSRGHRETPPPSGVEHTNTPASGAGHSNTPESTRPQNRGAGHNEPTSTAATDRQRQREAQEQRNRETQEQRNRQAEDRRREQEEAERQSSEAAALAAARAAEAAATRTSRVSRAVNPALAITRAALVADIAAKGVSALENGADQAAEQLLSDAALSGEESREVASLPREDIQSAIEERIGGSFTDSDQANQFAQNMNEIYSDPNQREEVVERFVEERGITRAQANKAYESEKDFYGQASQGLSNQNSMRAIAEATAAATRSPASEVVTAEPSVSELIDSARSIERIKQSLNELEEENKRIEDEISRESTTVSDGAINPTRRTPARSSGSSGAVASSSGSSGVIAGGSARLPISNVDSTVEEATEELEQNGPALVSEAEKEEQRQRLALEQSTKEEADRLAAVDEARESQLRIERSKFLSDLMNLLGGGAELNFRPLRGNEAALLGSNKERLNANLEMDSVRVMAIPSQGRNYMAFRDLQSERTIFIEVSTGRLIENIPLDLL